MLKTTGALVLLACTLSFASCKKNDPLKDIDKTALFAAPTAEELNAVQTAWQQRDLTPQDSKVEATYPITPQLTLKMISFRLYGNKQYASVLLPTTTKPLPVQLFVSGFGLDMPYSYGNVKVSSTDLLPIIHVTPALRGQSLTYIVNDITYTSPISEGTRNDAFDGATDDAIAALNAVSILFKEADTARVMVRGGSRGGTVAMLMAERDKRVKRAVGVAFPTELLAQTATHTKDPTYRFQFLDSLIDGKMTISQARLRMIASSPYYFYRQLPKTQIHFAEKDDITPVTQGQKLFDAMKAAGLDGDMQYFIYNGRDHHNIGDKNTEMEDRISQFFKQLY